MQPRLPRDDYRADLKISGSPVVRAILITVGTLFVILGAIGILIPLLPTTPFLLVAAACYARGSARFYHRIMNHRIVGPYLRAWRDEHRIPRKAKLIALVMITLTVGYAIAFIIPILAVKITLALIAIAVMVYIARHPD